jgi:hypothetical protein
MNYRSVLPKSELIVTRDGTGITICYCCPVLVKLCVGVCIRRTQYRLSSSPLYVNINTDTQRFNFMRVSVNLKEDRSRVLDNSTFKKVYT